ncbi:hypothetical protein ACFFX1_18945 [Dactylosporangium sucinum]|uniref:hypothetical protein n=1 Tax=Dactylosporangium sucinum TaxID=1424081 RepID=UPI001E31F484|nr:hypothetical protein [Dactylosporangium sucinum]
MQDHVDGQRDARLADEAGTRFASAWVAVATCASAEPTAVAAAPWSTCLRAC